MIVNERVGKNSRCVILNAATDLPHFRGRAALGQVGPGDGDALGADETALGGHDRRRDVLGAKVQGVVRANHGERIAVSVA